MDWDTFFKLPATITGWLTLAFIVVAGGIAIYGQFDKLMKARKKDTDASEDRLITLLQNTVTELEKKVDQQHEDLVKLTEEVEKVSAENKTFRDIFQGRDSQSQEFYKQSLESMKIVRETHDSVTTLVGTVQLLAENMKGLIAVLDHHVTGKKT